MSRVAQAVRRWPDKPTLAGSSPTEMGGLVSLILYADRGAHAECQGAHKLISRNSSQGKASRAKKECVWMFVQEIPAFIVEVVITVRYNRLVPDF